MRSEGVGFYAIGQALYQPSSLVVSFQTLTQLSEIAALRYSVAFCRHMSEIICEDAPTAIATAQIEVLLVDQLEPVGQTIAQFLWLPVRAKTSLTITHGGLNTILDSLSSGVLLVAIPITFEQPENSARIRWTQTGETIALSQLSVPKLQALIQQV